MSSYADFMPCLGSYNETKYGDDAKYACVHGYCFSKECVIAKLNAGTIPVEELPEFLSHWSPRVQQLAKSKLERS